MYWLFIVLHLLPLLQALHRESNQFMIRLGVADAHSYFQYLVNSVEDKLNPVLVSCSCKHYVKLKFFCVLLPVSCSFDINIM